MRTRPNLVSALGILIVFGLGTAVAEQLPVFEMGFSGLRAADFAPNEQQVATLAFPLANSGTVRVEIQIWDFRRQTLVQSGHFEVSIPSMALEDSQVRYSTDGLLLAVYAGGGTVHVFRSSDLQELTQIPLELSSAQLSGFEISPSSHILAVRRSFGGAARGGDLRIYDLDSGKQLRRWLIREGDLYPVYGVSGVAWSGEGKLLAVTAPSDRPFARFAGTIYILAPDSAEPVNRFGVRFPPGSLAFGSDDKLYVASMASGGYFAHWTTDLSIFNAKTGKQAGRIRAGKVGIRRTIAVSGNGRILLAYADRDKTTFEGLEDTLKVSDPQWQIVDVTAGRVIFTIPATEYADQCWLATSGRFLLNVETGKLRIFSIPVD